MTAEPTTTLDAAEVRACLAAARTAAAQLAAVVHQVSSQELGELFGELRDLAGAADAASVVTLAEAQSRGLSGGPGGFGGAAGFSASAGSAAVGPGAEGSPAARAGCRAWACRYARGTDAVTLSRLVTLACAAHLPSRAALSEAVSAAAVGLAHGVMVLREFERLEPRLVDTIKTEALGWFVQVAAQSNDSAQIRSLRPRIVARYGRERELERELDHQRARRSLSGAQQVEGMSAYMLVLDPEAAARFEAALDPLSAPAPTEAQRDLRSAGQRRADALIALVSRAVTAGEGVPVQAKAQLIVSIPWNDLALAARGSGVVLGRCEGAVLDPETVRKIACDAQLIPMVLGADSEPLDVGRAKRLVPPGMLKALWVRDQGCTYPGCHAPPAWTDAHHIRHWADGGATALPNLTLVCARHHTTVHRLGATATVRGSRVHWNL